MSSFSLKSAAAVATVLASPDYASIVAGRQSQLLARLQGAGNEIDSVLPILLSQTPVALERAFVNALLNYTAPAGTTPVSTDVRSGFSGSITSVGDGAAGSLEMVATVGLSLPALRTVYDAANDQVEDWLLEGSTAASGLDADGKPNIQRPTDFNLSTNAKVWFRKR